MAACSYLLFAYFLDASQPWNLHYAYSADGLHYSELNGGAAVLNCTQFSMRDPFINVAPDGRYYMVATNGQNFGGTPTILQWVSDDLIHWSPEHVIDVMGSQFFPPPTTVDDLWAPEWRWDAAKGEFMVFWAARGKGLLPALPSPNCSGQQDYRFGFFQTHTPDFVHFSPPTLFFDPGCYFTGDGGIDGDLVQDEKGQFVFVYKDARGVGEGHGAELKRGVRLATSVGIAGPYTNASVSDLLVPTLVEAPEVHTAPTGGPPGYLLYFDCSFWPTPPGQPRPPFGVAHSPSLAQPVFTTLPGSCTGNSSAVSFPRGATHGSFVCITDQQLQALRSAFPG